MRKILPLALLCAIAVSCRTVRYVPVESVRSDTVRMESVRRDSVYMHDSIFTVLRGDTVYVSRTRYVYKDRHRTDTLYRSRTDSVRVPYPVEKPLGRWGRIKQEAGGIAIGATLALAALLAFALVRRKRE